MAFSDYVLIRYLATYTDNASRIAQATNKKIRADAAKTSGIQSANYYKTVRGLNNVGLAAAQTGKALSTYVTLPILGVGAAATKMAVDFNTAMTRVHALTGASSKQIDQWSKSIMSLSEATGQGPKALADALYYVASAGLATNQVMPVVRDSAKAAATGMGDAAVVADVLTSALNAYRGTGLSAAKATDDLVAAIKYGKGEPTDFATSLGRVIGPAAQLRVNFGQTTGAIAALTNQGLDASEAVTGLRQVFVEFLKPSADSQKALKAMGFTANSLRLELGKAGLTHTLDDLRVRMGGLGIDTKKLGQIVKTSGTAAGLAYIAKHSKSLSDNIARVFPNVRALNAFLLLTGQNAAKTAVTIRQVSSDTGALNKAFRETVQRSAALQLKRLWSAVQVDLIQIGNIILPILVNVAKGLTGWLKALQNLSPHTRKLIVEAGLMVAAIGPLLYIVGQVAVATSAFLAILGGAPIAVGVAIAAFAAAGLSAKNGLHHPLAAVHQIIKTLQKDWPEIKRDAVLTFQTIGRVAGDMGGVVIDVLKGIRDFFTGDWHDMLKSAQDAMTRFGDLTSLVMRGLGHLIPAVMDQVIHSWQAAATAIGLVTLAIFRLKAAGGVGLVANILGGGGAASKSALAGESAGAQFAGVYGGTRLGKIGKGIGRLLGSPARALAVGRTNYAQLLEAQGGRQIEQAGISMSLTKSGASVFRSATGQFMAGAAVAETGAVTSNFVKMRAAAASVIPALGEVAGTLSTGGIAVAAVAAAAGIYLLVRAFTGGESAAQKMHDALAKLNTTQDSVRGLSRSVGPLALQLTSQRLNIQGLSQQISEYKHQLDGLKKGTQAYTTVELDLKQAQNARQQQVAQLQQQQSDYNKQVRTEISQAETLIRQQRQTSTQAVLNSIGAHNPAAANIIRQIQARIAGGAQNAGDLFNRFFGRNPRAAAAMGISQQDIKNLVTANREQQKMVGTIRAMTRSWVQMRQAGIDPASHAMVALRREITQASAVHFGLPVAGAQALSNAAGVPVGAAQAQRLQSIGGITGGVIDLARMLKAIPTVRQVRFVSNLPKELIAPLREFTSITHKLPTRQVLTLAANAGPASSAVAAFIAKNQHELEGFKAKHVDKIVNNLIAKISDVPKSALGAVTDYIRRTGNITTDQLHKIEKQVAASQRKLSAARQRVRDAQALIEAHPGAAGDSALTSQLRSAQADVRRLSSKANAEARKPQNRIKFHIAFTGAGVSGSADKSLATSLTNTLSHVSDTVAHRVTSQQLFGPVGQAIPAGVAVQFDKGTSIDMMHRHMANALGTGPNSGLLGRTMKGIGAASPSKLWAGTVGNAISTGIGMGIQAQAGQNALNSALNTVLQNALSFAKSHLKIGSPSKLMDQQVGYPMAQGIASGIRRGKGVIGQAVKSVVQHAVSQSSSMIGGGPSGAAGAAPPGQLRSWLSQALKITNHLSPGNLNALYGRAIQESGGNPKAINLWDSNAAAGHPSKGLLQTIDSTFSSYALPGHGNIWNPVDNAIAAIRYMFSRYGHIVGPGSGGYASGGPVAGMPGQPSMAIVHGGEFVLSRQMLANATSAHAVHRIHNATLHVHNLTIPPQAQNWIQRILRAFGFAVADPRGTVNRIRNDIANIMSHTHLSDRQKQEIAHFQSEYTQELSKKATTAAQKMAKESRLASIQYSISRVEGETKLTEIQKRELNRYKAELTKVLKAEKITAMLTVFVHDLNKGTLDHMEKIRAHIEAHIQAIKRGGVTPKERHELTTLKLKLAAVDGAVVQRLSKLNDVLNFRLTQANQGLTNLQLRQQLAGTDQTAAGQTAQAQYIKTNILPSLEKQLTTLRKEETAAEDIHNKKLARRIAEAIAAKQGDILQAQLDAQNAIKAATQATADALGGGASISFGYQNQQWTIGSLGLGVGA